MHKLEHFNVVVIGGGFYGCSVAIKMRQFFPRVLLIEKETTLLSRASLINQARVHNGYHYPRNIITAYRSYINFPRFIKDYNRCVIDDFDKIYVIAKSGSKVNAYQFREMFSGIGAPIERAPDRHRKLFNENLVEEVFTVKEIAFDATILRTMMIEDLEEAGVTVWLNSEVEKVEQTMSDQIKLSLYQGKDIVSDLVYNCTYSQINKMLKNSELPLLPFKHEVTEMALIEMPDELKKVGITVMDGPFFSTMPYPSKGLHTLSHVRYTPHHSWNDLDLYLDGHKHLSVLEKRSNYLYMLKDVERYLPIINEARYVESIFEIKTVLLQNEKDDGRPILYRENYGLNNFANIMGGKIDNIYDILEILEGKFKRKKLVPVGADN